MSAPDAIARLVRARYCVQLRVGTAVPLRSRMPVQRQSPPAGAAGRAWSTVTLTVGVPRTPKHARVHFVGADTWGGAATPCPPVRTARSGR